VTTVRVVSIFTILAGVENSYSAFAYPNYEVLRGISMIIFLVWVYFWVQLC